jgi:hypothetical protein
MMRLGRREHKYHAQATEYDGVRYDSKAEATRAEELDLLLRRGVQGYGYGIQMWVRQVGIRLGPDFATRVDFLVIGHGEHHCEEIKGFETPAFRTVRRLWKKYGPCPLAIRKREAEGWKTEWLKKP